MPQISNREQLIQGAITCLQDKGFARTTARDIAAASGANLASIGYHFGSKEALLNEALIRIFIERNAHVGRATFAKQDASPLERLRATFVAVTQLFEEHRPLLVAFVEAIAQAEHSPELRAQMASHYRDARKAVAEMIRSSLGPSAERMRTDPEVFASFLIATFDGLVIQWLLDSRNTPDGDRLLTSLLETIALSSEQEVRPVGSERGKRRGSQTSRRRKTASR